MTAVRQHLIDPEICIRCNTCEETCPIDAITHNEDNYVVLADKCDQHMDCVAPCPTGAIDNWRFVTSPYSIEEQFEWEELPEQEEGVEQEEPSDAHEASASSSRTSQAQPALEDEVSEILRIAHQGAGKVVAPASAAQPFINIYTRANPAVATVAGNYCITDPDSDSKIHHIVLDFSNTTFPVLEGQSIGVLPPGEDDKGKAHQVRLYSVASPRDGERPNHNNLSLTVKRVTADEASGTPDGLCSNYLCDLKKGDEVKVTGPFGNTFLMPDDPKANLIMICTGTGSAPFRAMTERRRRIRKTEDAGRLLLFFGARTGGELPYFGPLMKLPDDLITREVVFSRVPGQPKEYVQDRVLKCADNVAEWLDDDNTYLFICGLKGMEQGVNEALASLCRSHDKDWETLSQEMRQQGRLHIETY